MHKKLEYLCLVIDRDTGEEIREYIIEVNNYSTFETFSPDTCAKRIARGLFEKNMQYEPKLREYTSWYIDCCDL